MRRVRFVSIVIVVLLASASAAASERRTVRVELKPPVVTLRERAAITVSGIHARSLEVRLAGATDAHGRQLPWRPLRLAGNAWIGTPPAPALRGIYPLELRTDAGPSPFSPQRLLLRVFAPGTRARPSFDDPADVVRWWVRVVPHATLVALKPWPHPAFDRRDARLHRLFVVAYSPPGHPNVRDRLGMFVTAVRDGYDARWRLLEATVQP